jgi:hypothetical protein
MSERYSDVCRGDVRRNGVALEGSLSEAACEMQRTISAHTLCADGIREWRRNRKETIADYGHRHGQNRNRVSRLAG